MAVSLDQITEQVSSGSQALAQGATEQASSIEELSATINEITKEIRQNASNASSAKQQVEGDFTALSDSNGQMQNMIKAMNDITDKSNEIGKIIKTIDDIAFQTNILALNAAVEAARAGAAGKVSPLLPTKSEISPGNQRKQPRARQAWSNKP